MLRGLATLYVMRAEFDKTARLGEQILGFAEQENDPGLRVDGHLLVGFTLAFDGKLRAGLQHLDLAIGSIGSSPARALGLRLGNDPRVACLTTSAFTLWLLGFPDQAAERARSAITLSARLDHPFTAAYAQFHVGLLHLWLREPEVVLDRALRLLEIADEHDFQIWAAVGTCLLGVAQAGLGRHEIGLAEIRKGMDEYQGLRTPPVFWPMLLFLEAGAYGLGQQPAQGLSSIDAAIDSMNPGGQSSLLPELYLLKGDLLAAPDSSSAVDRSNADHWYRLAFQRAGDMEARMSELRAATRLCTPRTVAKRTTASATFARS